MSTRFHVLDTSPGASASYLFDCHVRMYGSAIETVLYAVQYLTGNGALVQQSAPDVWGLSPRGGRVPMAEDKLLFTDPSVLWAQSCAANYRWLAKYAFEIAAEWTERNAVPTTNLRRHIEWLEQNVPAGLDKGPTEVQWDLYPQRVSRWIVDLKLPTITAERLFYLELFRREDVSCYFGYDEVEEPEFLTDENLMAKWQTHLGVKRDRRMEQERLATTLGKRASAELQDKEQQEPSPKCVAVSCE